MSFLPEDDQDYLLIKGLPYELKAERLADGSERRGVLFPGFVFEGTLWTRKDDNIVPCSSCDLLILIPSGYSTTKLDSFYTRQVLKRADGTDPINANAIQDLFQEKWQFWSRHLTDEDWRM